MPLRGKAKGLERGENNDEGLIVPIDTIDKKPPPMTVKRPTTTLMRPLTVVSVRLQLRHNVAPLGSCPSF